MIVGASVAGAPKASAQRLPCAVWVVRNALQSAASWTATLNAVERTGCRRMYLQISGRWDAYFPSQVFPRPQSASWPQEWSDPTGAAIRQARARGIEVHLWVNALLAWSAARAPADPDHVFRRHREWFVTDDLGRSMRSMSRGELDRTGLAGEGWFLDPRQVAVRTELRRFILEVALKYEFDGIHLDYIRYPRGWAPDDGSDAVTKLVALIRDDLRTTRPGMELSAAVLPIPGESLRSFGQPWDQWLEKDLIDVAVPMVYRETPESVLAIVRDYPGSVPRGRVWVGLRLDRLTPTEVRAAADRLAEEGIAGTALFSHNFLMELPAWGVVRPIGRASDFLDLTRPDAARADPDPAHGAVYLGANRLDVGIEAAPVLVIGMTDAVAVLGPLPTNVANPGHMGTLNRIVWARSLRMRTLKFTR